MEYPFPVVYHVTYHINVLLYAPQGIVPSNVEFEPSYGSESRSCLFVRHLHGDVWRRVCQRFLNGFGVVHELGDRIKSLDEPGRARMDCSYGSFTIHCTRLLSLNTNWNHHLLKHIHDVIDEEFSIEFPNPRFKQWLLQWTSWASLVS